MFLIKSDDNFLKIKCLSLLGQNGFHITQDQNSNYFETIIIKKHEKVVQVTMGKNNFDLNLPMTITNMYYEFKNLINKFNIYIGELVYSPEQGILSFHSIKLYLSDVHKIMFNEIILHKKSGVEKAYLYKQIWPKDKNFNYNKIDTHLSNLKRQIEDQLGLVVKLNSNKRVINLVID